MKNSLKKSAVKLLAPALVLAFGLSSGCGEVAKLEPCAKVITKKGEYLNGIDLSHVNGNIDFNKVLSGDIQFTYIKATEGTGFTDPKFAENWQNSGSSEIIRGAYHFFHANVDAQKQAEFFLKTVGELGPCDLPPMLDVEVSDHIDNKALADDALVWLKYVKKATGRTPVIYTYNQFADPVLKNHELGDYYLWIASLTEKVTKVPDPWIGKKWYFWQYSINNTVPGVEKPNVDRDRFNGDGVALVEFIEDSKK